MQRAVFFKKIAIVAMVVMFFLAAVIGNTIDLVKEKMLWMICLKRRNMTEPPLIPE